MQIYISAIMIKSSQLFSPMLMRSFVAVAEANSFSMAARRLGLQQSTVSQHVQKLEEAVGRKLLERTTQKLSLTHSGLEMLEISRDILAAYERMGRRFESKQLTGTIRIGSIEDYSIEQMPRMLLQFRRLHPGVQVELKVGPMAQLQDMLTRGDIDIFVGIRRTGSQLGRLVRRESIGWYSRPGFQIDVDEPLPLVLYSAPNVMRDVTIEACEKAGRAWRETGSSPSYLGLRAAVLAGLGVMAIGESAEPKTVQLAQATNDLPRIEDVELILMQRFEGGVAKELADMVLAQKSSPRQGAIA